MRPLKNDCAHGHHSQERQLLSWFCEETFTCYNTSPFTSCHCPFNEWLPSVTVTVLGFAPARRLERVSLRSPHVSRRKRITRLLEQSSPRSTSSRRRCCVGGVALY